MTLKNAGFATKNDRKSNVKNLYLSVHHTHHVITIFKNIFIKRVDTHTRGRV